MERITLPKIQKTRGRIEEMTKAGVERREEGHGFLIAKIQHGIV